MQKNQFEHWLENIQNTEEEEISCTECFDLVSHFVELELSGEDAATRLPQLKQHLAQCPACQAEHEALRDFQRLENRGELPSLDDLQDLIL